MKSDERVYAVRHEHEGIVLYGTEGDCIRFMEEQCTGVTHEQMLGVCASGEWQLAYDGSGLKVEEITEGVEHVRRLLQEMHSIYDTIDQLSEHTSNPLACRWAIQR